MAEQQPPESFEPVSRDPKSPILDHFPLFLPTLDDGAVDAISYQTQILKNITLYFNNMVDAQAAEDSRKRMPEVKRILSYVSLAFSIGSMCLIFAIGVAAWLALDDFEKKMEAAANSACSGITGAVNALNSFGDVVGNIKNSLNATSDSFFILGNSFTTAAHSLSLLNKELGEEVGKAGEKMIESSRLVSSADEKIDEAQESISMVRSSLLSERNLFCDNKIKDEIGKIRILLVLCLLVAFAFAAVLSLNSISNVL